MENNELPPTEGLTGTPVNDLDAARSGATRGRRRRHTTRPKSEETPQEGSTNQTESLAAPVVEAPVALEPVAKAPRQSRQRRNPRSRPEPQPADPPPAGMVGDALAASAVADTTAAPSSFGASEVPVAAPAAFDAKPDDSAGPKPAPTTSAEQSRTQRRYRFDRPAPPVVITAPPSRLGPLSTLWKGNEKSPAGSVSPEPRVTEILPPPERRERPHPRAHSALLARTCWEHMPPIARGQ